VTALSLALGFLGLLGFAGYYLTLRERRPRPVAQLVTECKAAAEAAKEIAAEAKAAGEKATASAAAVRKDMDALALAAGLTRRLAQPQPEQLKD